MPYGLAAFAFTNSAKTAEKISASIESGIVSVNQPWMPVVEVPFGGIKDSGYGKELGTEAWKPICNQNLLHKNRVFRFCLNNYKIFLQILL